jgi:hypothetical protein
MLAQVVLELPIHNGLCWDIRSWSSSQSSVMWRMDLQMKFNRSNNLSLLQVMAASPNRRCPAELQLIADLMWLLAFGTLFGVADAACATKTVKLLSCLHVLCSAQPRGRPVRSCIKTPSTHAVHTRSHPFVLCKTATTNVSVIVNAWARNF